MSSTIEDRGRSKKRRTDDEGVTERPEAENKEATGGGFAASCGDPAGPTPDPSTLKSINTKLGPRLEATTAALATLPTELQDLLIPELTGMLSLHATIKQRKETLERHDKPMLDPKTKKPQKQLSDPEKDLPFIASSLRKALPLKCSDELKDDPDMKRLMNETAADWELYAKIKMAERDKQIKQLEVEKRLEKLREQFFSFAVTWAKGLAINATIDTETSVLSVVELGQIAAHNAVSALPADALGVLNFTSTKAATDLLQEKQGFNYRDTLKKCAGSLFENDGDRVDQQISKLFTKQLKTVVLECWFKDKEKEKARKVNAKIRELLRPKVEAEKTADVRAALDSEGHNGQGERLLEEVRKTARSETTKQMQRVIKSQRKKSLGGVEFVDQTTSKPKHSGQNGSKKSKKSLDGVKSVDQTTSKPKNSGQNGSKKSKKSDGQQKQQQQQKQPTRSALKKGKKVRFSSSKSTASSPGTKNDRGNQGGAKGGGRKRSAGKR